MPKYSILYRSASGDWLPYCPEYTGISYQAGFALLPKLKAQYPRERFGLREDGQPHLTVMEGRKALRKLFHDGQRKDLLALVPCVRRADIPLLAPLALDAALKQQRIDEFERVNEKRRSQGLRPFPRPALRKAEPEIVTRNGRVVIRLGGAR